MPASQSSGYPFITSDSLFAKGGKGGQRGKEKGERAKEKGERRKEEKPQPR